MNPLEKDFLEGFQKRVTVVCGSKGSGKTHICLSLLRMCYYYNLFEKYILVLL